MSKNESEERQAVKKELTSSIRQTKEERKLILKELKVRGPLTVPQLAETTRLPPDEVLRQILIMMKSGEVVEAGEKDGGYAYEVKH